MAEFDELITKLREVTGGSFGVTWAPRIADTVAPLPSILVRVRRLLNALRTKLIWSISLFKTSKNKLVMASNI